MSQALGRKIGEWTHEFDQRSASLDFDWTPEELEQIHARVLPERMKPSLVAKWQRVRKRALIASAPIALILLIVWLVMANAVSGRGDSMVPVYVMGIFFLVMAFASVLVAWLTYSTKRKLVNKALAARFVQGNRVQFGASQNRRWRFSSEDLAALRDGQKYNVYLAGHQLVYLEEL